MEDGAALQEYQPTDGCCKRRIICGKLFFPPRLSGDSHRNYAVILTPISVILCAIAFISYVLLQKWHHYLHSSERILLYSVIGTGVLVMAAVIVAGVCIVSWWNSMSCIQYAALGDFAEAEQDYVVGKQMSRATGEHIDKMMFFSVVKPAEESHDILNNSDVDTIPVGRYNTSSSYTFTNPLTEADQNKYTASNNDAYLENLHRWRLADSRHQLSQRAPFFSCCYDDESIDQSLYL